MSKISSGWLFFYSLATKYYEYYGDLDVPSTFKTRNGYEEVKGNEEGIFDLGQWITRQRFGNIENEHYNLTEEKRELLNKIEMIWDVNEYRWNKMYELAKKYYEHYGHLNVSRSFRTKNGYDEDENGFPLGQWVHTQRRRYRGELKVNLTDKQLFLLEELNIIWFIKNDSQCQRELITSSNNFRKKREIYNRFRSFLNGISNHNTLSKEEINEMFMNQLNNKIQKEEQRSNDLKVNCLESALYETIRDYGYEKFSDRLEMLIYCLVEHIDRVDQYEEACLAFTKKNGARDYIRSKDKATLIDEMKQLLLLDHQNIESIEDIYQEYASSFYHKRYDSVQIGNKKKR